MADTRRYFHIESDGPSWTVIAARPSDAWKLWAAHESADGTGFLDGSDGCDEDGPAFSMREIDAAAAATIMVDDSESGNPRRPLTDFAIGDVFTSEF